MFDLAILLVLSILFTSFAFVTSHIMMKLLNINHPRNRFWVYSIALATAFSLFSFIGISIASQTNSQLGNIFDSIGEQNSQQAVIQEEDDIENYTFSPNDIVIISPVINCTTSNETDSDSNYTNFSSLERLGFIISEQGQQTQIFIDDEIIQTLYHESKEKQGTENRPGDGIHASTSKEDQEKIAQIFSKYLLLASAFKRNSRILQEKQGPPLDNPVDKPNGNPKYSNINYGLIFLLGNLLLFIASILYIGWSLTSGKRHTLKGINAEPCKNPELPRMVKELSHDLNIKTPKVFIFDGAPNAFVFGYPITLALSKALIKCLSKEELKMTMQHELAHIKNRDIVIKPILQALRILFFYNPAVHLLYYKIVKERELLADRLCLHSKAEKITFIEALIKIQEYTKRHKYSSNPIFSYHSLLWVSPNLEPLKMKDRFNYLLTGSQKKSLCSITICILILISNLSFISVAQSVLSTPPVFNEVQKPITSDMNQEIPDYNHPFRYIYIFRDDPCTFRRYIIQCTDFYQYSD